MNCCQTRRSSGSKGSKDTKGGQASRIWFHGLASTQQGRDDDMPNESRHRISAAPEADRRDARPASLTDRPFNAKLMNEACREALRSGDVGLSRALGPSWEGGARGEAAQAVGGVLTTTEGKPWWYKQMQAATSQARVEGSERVRRRQYAAAAAKAEQEWRVAEEEKNAVEEGHERKRRREFAKRALAEEQYTRVREQLAASARDDAERERRRRWAVKALREEERRRVEERLRRRQQSQDVSEQRHKEPPFAARQRHALFLGGVRLWMQFYRSEAGAGKGPVVQALKDLYTRECLKVGMRQRSQGVKHIPQRPVTWAGGAPSLPLSRVHADASSTPSERSWIDQAASLRLEPRLQRVNHLSRLAPSPISSASPSSLPHTPPPPSKESEIAVLMEEQKRVQYSSRSRRAGRGDSEMAVDDARGSGRDMRRAEVQGESPPLPAPPEFRPMPTRLLGLNRIVA